MRSAMCLRSLYPDNPIYIWSAKSGWEEKDKDFMLPKSLWLSSQTGIQVGTFGSVDVDSFHDLLGNLPTVLNDLILDAAERIGFKDTKALSPLRWEKLSSPRPTVGNPELKETTIYAQRGNQIFMLDIDSKGRGGWYKVSSLPKSPMQTFEMWDYKVYCPKTETVTLPSCCARRLITATLDSLYCYPDDDAIRSYIVWAQDKIRSQWEGKTANESKGAH